MSTETEHAEAQTPNPHGEEYWRAWQQARAWGEDFLRGQLELAEEMKQARERDLAAAQGRVAGLRDALTDHHQNRPEESR